MTVSINGTSGLVFTDGTSQNTSPFTGGLGFRNRIINGDMKIDQRNAGASVTPTGSAYTLDRWLYGLTQASKASIQQNAGSVTPPAGFVNYLGITSTSAYAVLTSDAFLISQRVEGNNIADLNWGTASASTITISFWVRSSLTGTFGGSLRNSGNTRSYPFSYTINSANTWEQKTLTIPGDTSGTWLTTNGQGVEVAFSVGSGATYSGTAGSWASANYTSATGATSVVGTNGATFYITGVQLEKGSTATSFDYRPYGTELRLCQRYYYRTVSYSLGAAINGDITYSPSVVFPVTMRSAPTLDAAGNTYEVNMGSAGTPGTYNALGLRTNVNSATMRNVSNNWTSPCYVCVSAGFSAEL